MSGGARGAAVAAAALLLSACAGSGVPNEELPPTPIAISYLEPEPARQRAEKRREEAEGHLAGRREAALTSPAPEAYENRAIATPDSVSDFLGRAFGGTQAEREFRPRLALLDPKAGSITPIEAARRGSVAQDWSPDHARLLFAQPGERDVQLHEFDLAKRLVRPLTRGPDAHPQGCYLAGGRLAVAVVEFDRNPIPSHIAVSGPGGGGPFRRISEGPADHSPTCAPDGRSLVFVRETSATRTELWILDLEGDAPPRRLAPGRHPRFSPDGEWIAFAAPYQRELRIYRMRPDGSGRAPVGRGIRHEARPDFSPDGRLLVYVAGEDPLRRQLYLRRFDGSGDRILFADGDAEYPVW